MRRLFIAAIPCLAASFASAQMLSTIVNDTHRSSGGGGGGGSIAFVAFTSYGNCGTTSCSVSQTINAATNYLTECILLGTRTDDMTSVTFNGVAMTQLKKQLGANSNFGQMYLYGLANPAPGTHNLGINTAGGEAAITMSAEYSGVNTSGQPDATASADEDNLTPNLTYSITSVADNSWAVSCWQQINADATAGTGLNGRGTDATFHIGMGDSGVIHPAGAHSMTWNGGGAGPNSILSSLAATLKP